VRFAEAWEATVEVPEYDIMGNATGGTIRFQPNLRPMHPLDPTARADPRGHWAMADKPGGAGAVRDGQPFGLLPGSKPTGEMVAYHPTLRDRLGNLIYDTATSAGFGFDANNKREYSQIFADFTPAGTVFDLEDAYRAVDAGNYWDAALQASLATLGAAVPIAGRIASKVVKKLARSPIADEALSAAVERAQSEWRRRR